MNAEGLLEVYERISEAPGAVVRLRRFVLDLAVRGKLVEQHAGDEAASELLKQIDDEKSRLAKAGQIKKQKPLKNISSGEKEFELPIGWAWTRLGEIGQIGSSKRVLQSDWKTAGVPFYRAREIVVLSKFGVVENELFISDKRFEELSQVGHVPEAGDIMITGVGTIGIPYVVRDTDRFYFKDASVLIFKNIFSLFTGFLLLLMRSPYWNERVHSESMGTTVHTLTINRANAICLPLPPLAEQHRIVAKVDELMALCDRLEEARKTREEVRDKLTAASLTRLTAPETTAEDFPTRAAFALEALPALTTRPDQIKTLRQTILNLAVRGKLVEQDRTGGTGDELLRNILAVPWDKKRKAIELEPDEAAMASAFPLPPNWTWATVQALTRLNQTVTYGILKPEWMDEGVPTVRVTEMKTGEIDASTLPRCRPERAAKFAKTTLEAGDLLVSKDGTIGKTAFVPPELAGGNITQHVLRFPICEQVDRRFVRLAIDAPFCQSWMDGETKGVALQGVNVGDFRRMPIPLPPLAEQHRIVAKVDALMSLCDRLEAALTTTDTTRTRLLEALLHKALEPAVQTLEAAQ